MSVWRGCKRLSMLKKITVYRIKYAFDEFFHDHFFPRRKAANLCHLDLKYLLSLYAGLNQTNRRARKWEEVVWQKAPWWQCVAPQELGGNLLPRKKVDNPWAILQTRGEARRDWHGCWLGTKITASTWRQFSSNFAAIQSILVKVSYNHQGWNPLASRFLFCCSKSQKQTEVSEDQGKINCGASFRIISFEALCLTCLIIVINDGFLSKKIHYF